jgi:hypothetical protein
VDREKVIVESLHSIYHVLEVSTRTIRIIGDRITMRYSSDTTSHCLVSLETTHRNGGFAGLVKKIPHISAK